MNEYEYAQFESEHFDQLAKQFDGVCEHHLKNINEYLSNEKPPYPPPHTVTLARAVHVLAMRTLADEHPAKHPSSKSYMSKGRHGLHRYWVTVFRINDGVNLAAQTGALRLRDRLTGFPIQDWHTPSKVECAEWERFAIFPNDDRQAADRQAIEIMSTSKWPLLAPHFYTDVVVSLAELDTWAAGIGIVDAGGVTALLQTIEAKAAERARVTAVAIAAEERGERFDLSKFALEQQQNTAAPAPVGADSASDGVEPDKSGPLPVEQGLSTKDIAHAFDGVNGWSADRWLKNLSASKWLHPARIAIGGAGGASSVWSPVMLAQLMHDNAKGEREKEKLMKVLNSRFTRNPALGLWRDAFNEYFATYCATD